MRNHVVEWVDVYLDGETDTAQTQQIESHLLVCDECSKLFNQRKNLSKLLQAQPPASHLKPERQFAREVTTRILSQQKTVKTKSQLPEFGWVGIPLLLVVGLAFIQAVFLESSLMRFVPGASDVIGPNLYLLPFSFALPEPANQLIKFLVGLNLWSWDWTTGLLLAAGGSFLYISWLAGWWIRGQHQTTILR